MTNTAKTLSYTVTSADALRLLTALSVLTDAVRFSAEDVDRLDQLAALGLVGWGFDAYGDRYFEPTHDGSALATRAEEAARAVVGAELFDRAVR